MEEKKKRFVVVPGRIREEENTDIRGQIKKGASQAVLVVKNLHAIAGDIRDTGWSPRSGSSPGGGHGNPLQNSCLENLTDSGTWWAMVQGGLKGPDTTEATKHTRMHAPGRIREEETVTLEAKLKD